MENKCKFFVIHLGLSGEIPYDASMIKTFLLSVLLLIPYAVYTQSAIVVELKVFPPDYSLYIDGEKEPAETFEMPENRRGIRIPPGRHMFRFTAEGYEEKIRFYHCDTHKMLIEEKLEKVDGTYRFFRRLDTGIQPKSVEFTPDGKYMVTALLQDRGIQVFDTTTFSKIDIEAIPEEFAKAGGFVEFAFIESRKEMWVSQMTTHRVHIYDYTDFSYEGNIDIRGNWSKVIAVSPDESTAYISNWVSGDISVIDVAERKFLSLIPVGGTPRGMAFSKDGAFLYVCRYDNGTILKIDTETRKIVKTLDFGGWGAKRHIVLDKVRNIFYVSDMARHTVVVFDGETDAFLDEIRIDYNPNTIALNSDGSRLYIATRGRNHPESYLIKGYYFGKIFVMDTESREIIEWFWGMNQPTGLALSPDDRFLAYTNFLDYTIEVYKTGFQEN